MQKYKSKKEVLARPMTKDEARSIGLVQAENLGSEDGFIVKHNEAYSTWMDKKTFEGRYYGL